LLRLKKIQRDDFTRMSVMNAYKFYVTVYDVNRN